MAPLFTIILIIPCVLFSSLVLAVENQVNSTVSQGTKDLPKEETKEETKEDEMMREFLKKPKNPFQSLLPKPEPVKIVPPVKPVPVNKTKPVPPTPVKKEIISQAGLNVTINGVVWGGEKPQAILNGKIVKVGDPIEEMKVESITRQGIGVLYTGIKYKGQRIILKID